MRAATFDGYGPLDAVSLGDAPQPVPGKGEVLIRVRASALGVGDVFSVRGTPFMIRMASGVFKPRWGIPGYDFAGTVEAVGDDVADVKPGDDVFGGSTATCAEFTLAKPKQLAPKPPSLSFEEAASMPTVGSAALQGLRDAGKLRAGQRLLIIGASGGIGTLGVQIAKAMGAHVTGVCSTSNVDLVRSLGADGVIDYTREDFVASDQRYDVILDNVENRTFAEVRSVLAPSGTLVLNSGTGASGLPMLMRLVRPVLQSPFSKQSYKRFFSAPSTANLTYLSDLVAAGKLRPVVAQVYPLAETAAALAHVAGGHARGRVVVAI